MSQPTADIDDNEYQRLGSEIHAMIAEDERLEKQKNEFLSSVILYCKNALAIIEANPKDTIQLIMKEIENLTKEFESRSEKDLRYIFQFVELRQNLDQILIITSNIQSVEIREALARLVKPLESIALYYHLVK
jgi:transcriptional regulator of heat shock response